MGRFGRVMSLETSIVGLSWENEDGSARTVAQFCSERGIDERQLAARSGVDEQRIAAILLGRWTPSPEERDAIAAVFGVTRAEIVWGHTIPVHISMGKARRSRR